MAYSTFGRQSRIRVKANSCDVHSEKLEQYYIDWIDLADFAKHSKLVVFDSAGMPQWNYGGAIGLRRQPTLIAQYALSLFDIALQTNEQETRNEFLHHADWLMDNSRPGEHGAAVWFFDFNVKAFNTGFRWISALTQGNVISVLLRAYQMSGDRGYLDKATEAAIVFKHSYDEGGVASRDTDGNLWFEECATEQPAHILNGFIFGVFGLQDLNRVTRNDVYCDLLQQARQTLLRTLTDFDSGQWSFYDLLRRRNASRYYHEKVHIPQLEALYRIFGDELFIETSRRWRRYAMSPLMKMIHIKNDLIKKVKKASKTIIRRVWGLLPTKIYRE